MIQFIFNNYIDLTIKDSERIRRGTDVTDELSEIQPMAILPAMMDSFWESDENKKLLIDCAYKYYLQYTNSHSVVCSGYLRQVNEIRQSAMSTSGSERCVLEEISSFPQEAEADMQIIPHLLGTWFLQLLHNFSKRYRYIHIYLSMGLKSLYMRIGV